MAVARILATGSRSAPATSKPKFFRHLDTVLHVYGRITLVHGDCGEGVDEWCNEWAAFHPDTVEVERHPADWTQPCRSTCRPGHRRCRRSRFICPAAGLYRNDRMVSLGATECLAGIHNNSRGATHCARSAEHAGIPTLRIPL